MLDSPLAENFPASTASTLVWWRTNSESISRGLVGMESKQVLSTAETLLRGVSVQLENAEHDLRMLRATIKRTNEVIRSSREAIVRTDALVQPDEPSEKE
jgi:hypothetical protein